MARANHDLLQHISLGEPKDTGAATIFAGASADGSRVFFSTTGSLVSADTDSSQDIYERSGGVTTLISRGQINGNGGFGVSFQDASADGSRVLFNTQEQLVATDTDGSLDIYQRSGSTTTLISAGQVNGNGAFNPTFRHATADGSQVIFATAEKLVSADTDSVQDIYLRSGGTTTRISAGQVNGNGALPAETVGASADGTRVFLRTNEPLVPADTDGSQDIYERSGGVTTLISAGQINGNGAFNASGGFASEDGSRVVFVTAEKLVSADTDTRTDVYQRAAGTTTLVSIGQINGNGNFDADTQGASADGSRVFFRTEEQLVSTDTDTRRDVYERTGGTTTLISAGEINGNGPFHAGVDRVSTDGSRVLFATTEPLVSATPTPCSTSTSAPAEPRR